MKTKTQYLWLLLATLCSIQCSTESQKLPKTTTTSSFTSYVNPFIGTSKMGHVFPGATAPFGMVQLSPQTNFEPMFSEAGKYNSKTYEYCAGYQYKDTTIIGFAHTNFSGTGHADLGDFLVMPTTGKLQLNPFPTQEQPEGYYSTFSHKNETASPGYYRVLLDKYQIEASLTASERVGFHQYKFPKTKRMPTYSSTSCIMYTITTTKTYGPLYA